MTKLPKDIRNALSPKSAAIDPRFKSTLKKLIIEGETMAQTKKLPLFTRKHLLPLTGASLVLASVFGIGSYLYTQNRNEEALLREVELPGDLSGLKSVDEIRAAALVGLDSSVSISAIELENEDEGLLYKVKFSNGTFKLFDARTGTMVSKSDLEIDASVPADFVAGVTIESARATAQGVFPDKTVVKIELEMEGTVVVYSVRFSDDSRVDVSAVDGSVVRTRNEATGARTGSDDNSDDSDDDNSNDSNDDSVDDNSGSSSSNSGSGGGDDDSGEN